ncbi:hypothetical protein BKA62DRAFT_724286 [Auriculariales sp. MPI-PUGE-AT-0066]|nr:hypothetical protein BKA62DRAFT_724286 [Auriculariales sp. MPI-PUGE-AT-0066]
MLIRIRNIVPISPSSRATKACCPHIRPWILFSSYAFSSQLLPSPTSESLCWGMSCLTSSTRRTPLAVPRLLLLGTPPVCFRSAVFCTELRPPSPVDTTLHPLPPDAGSHTKHDGQTKRTGQAAPPPLWSRIWELSDERELHQSAVQHQSIWSTSAGHLRFHVPDDFKTPLSTLKRVYTVLSASGAISASTFSDSVRSPSHP